MATSHLNSQASCCWSDLLRYAASRNLMIPLLRNSGFHKAFIHHRQKNPTAPPTAKFLDDFSFRNYFCPSPPHLHSIPADPLFPKFNQSLQITSPLLPSEAAL